MKNSFGILSLFTLGIWIGRVSGQVELLETEDWSFYILSILLFLVGIGIGADVSSFHVLKAQKFKVILVPLAIIIGSLSGVFVSSIFLPNMLLKDALAVGAGFGYYSLSAIFITELRGEELGAIALLTNIIREIMTLLLTPLFVFFFGKLAGIASGGATSMDTTLPIIVKYSGKEWAVISVFSGIVLTIVVPFLVPFVLEVF